LCFSIRCEAPMHGHILTVLIDVVVFAELCRHAEAMSHHAEVLSDGSVQKDSLVMRREMSRANECWRDESWTSECPKYDQKRCTSYTEKECTSSCSTGQICLKLQMSPVSYTCCTDATASAWSTSASVTASEDKAKPSDNQELHAKKADAEGTGKHRQSGDDTAHSDKDKESSQELHSKADVESQKKSKEPGKDGTHSRDSDKGSDDKPPLEDKLSALEKKKREAEEQVKKLEEERQRLAKEAAKDSEKSQAPHQEAGPEEQPHEESGAPKDLPFSGGRAFEAQIFGEKLEEA
ncbi:unnamed protein product, partial [Symbiodinium necroappetens]